MYLDISRLEEGTTSLDFVDSPESYTAKNPTLQFVQPVKVHVSIIKTGSHLIVIGEAVSSIQATCSRCLEPIKHPVQTEFTIELRPQSMKTTEPAEGNKRKRVTRLESEDNEPEEAEIGEGDIGYYIEDKYDLSEVTRQYLELSIPMQPLCKETCLGLCPMCGANLNKGKCSCPPVEQDHPFAELKKKVILKSKI
ncbi:MAG: DUF177 domain-containing protein [bacterium]